MSFTSPKTWASGYVVLASDLNTHLRDNLNMTAPAVMSAQGDIVIASGANTPIRLAKSTTSTQYLANTGTSNAPAWNEVALATGVSGTLPVGNGGTGATTLTANGALIGNGTSAIASVDMSTKGGLLAGDGSGNPSVLAIGGSNDHVLTVDSGETTGMKWAAAAGGGPDQADQAALEAETNEDTYAPPDLLHFGPWACKAWGEAAANGASLLASYNVGSLTDNGGGDVVYNFSTAFSSVNYPHANGVSHVTPDNDVLWGSNNYTKAAGALRMIALVEGGSAQDKQQGMMVFGDQ